MGILSDAALEAFDDVASEIPGVIKSGNLVRSTGAYYSPENGTFADAAAPSWPCRWFETTDRATRDLLAPYVVGPSEVTAIVQGLTERPKEGDRLGNRTIRAVGDYYGAGEVFVVAMA